MRRRTLVMAAALVMVVALGVAGCSAEGGAIGNADLLRLQQEGARVVDVRTAGEYAAGYIPGAELVPLMELGQTAESWDKGEPIVLYCATGSRSAEAAQILRSMGFQEVYDLTAGIIAWDGQIASGPDTAGTVTDPGDTQTAGMPVLYEFYTDW